MNLSFGQIRTGQNPRGNTGVGIWQLRILCEITQIYEVG